MPGKTRSGFVSILTFSYDYGSECLDVGFVGFKELNHVRAQYINIDLYNTGNTTYYVVG